MVSIAIEIVQKLPSGIPGFDHISEGGLPEGRATLVAGSAGSGKTVFASQFLAGGIARGEPGVFVTLEESPDDIRRNLVSLGWDLPEWERQGKWAFVDASPDAGDDAVVSGSYDLTGLLARIDNTAKRAGARRVVIDAIGALMNRFQHPVAVRIEISRIVAGLKRLGLTTLLTTERTEEYGEISRGGIEEFVADNVIILRNALDCERRRRTVEILKFRGTAHQKGEFPFTVRAGGGLFVLPLCAGNATRRSSEERISCGISELDKMCGGGFFRDAIVLISGATGTGKTLLSTQFLAAGAAAGEHVLLLAFEESREQLLRNAAAWGVDFRGMERAGNLRIHCDYPEAAGSEDHLLRVLRIIEEHRPRRLVLDSLSAMERATSPRSFREFVLGISAMVKEHQIAGLFTATTDQLMGGFSVTDAHISTITDSIILLRYVEMFGEMRRGLTILKMRGSRHDKNIREFVIDDNGMQVGRPFRDITGIMAGTTLYVASAEMERLAKLFPNE